MKAKVIETIKKYDMISQGATIVLAVSGGVDSMVLMQLFAHLRNDFDLTIIIAHLDHAKRQTSPLDLKLVLQQAKRYGFIFEQDRLPPQNQSGNFQAYARAYRYKFLTRIAKLHRAQRVVTAHHANDHLETVIDLLLKTELPASLAGIRPTLQIDESLMIIRPLITLSKMELYAYANKHDICFNEDESNLSDIYLRNRIRQQIVPLMTRERADVLEHVRNLSDKLQADEAYFAKQVDELMKDVVVDEQGYWFSNSWLQTLHISLRRRLILRLLPKISKGAMSGLGDFLVSGTASGKFAVGGGMVVQKSYDSIKIRRATMLVPAASYEYELPLNTNNLLPNGQKIVIKQEYNRKNAKNEAQGTYLCYNSICMPLRVRNRRTGDKIELANRQGHASVKKLMIDAKVPVDKRANWPIIVDANDQLIWVLGLKKSPVCRKRPTSNQDLWLEIWK